MRLPLETADERKLRQKKRRVRLEKRRAERDRRRADRERLRNELPQEDELQDEDEFLDEVLEKDQDWDKEEGKYRLRGYTDSEKYNDDVRPVAKVIEHWDKFPPGERELELLNRIHSYVCRKRGWKVQSLNWSLAWDALANGYCTWLEEYRKLPAIIDLEHLKNYLFMSIWTGMRDVQKKLKREDLNPKREDDLGKRAEAASVDPTRPKYHSAYIYLSQRYSLFGDGSKGEWAEPLDQTNTACDERLEWIEAELEKAIRAEKPGRLKKLRRIIKLRRKDWSYEQIEKQTGIPARTANDYVHRVAERMPAELKLLKSQVLDGIFRRKSREILLVVREDGLAQLKAAELRWAKFFASF